MLSKTKIIHLDGDLTSQHSVGSRGLFKVENWSKNDLQVKKSLALWAKIFIL